MASVRDVRPKMVPIVLDKERHLKFDLNAFAEIEEQYGSVDEAMDALEKGSIKALRVVLWAGLIHEELDENGNPKVTPKEVGSLIDITSFAMLQKKLGEAMTNDLGDLGDSEEAKEAKEEAPLAVQSTKMMDGTGH